MTSTSLMITIETLHPCSTGDKLCSLNGQKGVLQKRAKLPYVMINGITIKPHILINCYCIISRQTMGQIQEMLKNGGDFMKVFNSEGIQIPNVIALVGLVFYMALLYWGNEHYYNATKCNRDKISGIPIRGRSRQGGMRTGNMELFNCYRGNGCASCYEKTMQENSNRIIVHNIPIPQSHFLCNQDAHYYKTKIEYYIRKAVVILKSSKKYKLRLKKMLENQSNDDEIQNNLENNEKHVLDNQLKEDDDETPKEICDFENNGKQKLDEDNDVTPKEICKMNFDNNGKQKLDEIQNNLENNEKHVLDNQLKEDDDETPKEICDLNNLENNGKQKLDEDNDVTPKEICKMNFDNNGKQKLDEDSDVTPKEIFKMNSSNFKNYKRKLNNKKHKPLKEDDNEISKKICKNQSNNFENDRKRKLEKNRKRKCEKQSDKDDETPPEKISKKQSYILEKNRKRKCEKQSDKDDETPPDKISKKQSYILEKNRKRKCEKQSDTDDETPPAKISKK